MKHNFLIIFFALLSIINVEARDANKSISVGVENNKYIIADYVYDKFDIGIKHSVFSESFKNQYFQFNLGYTQSIGKYCQLSATPSFGSVYNGDYYILKGTITGKVFAHKRVTFLADLQPHYDSGLSYSTYYRFGTLINVFKEVSLKLAYTDIPEYRMPEKRINAGVLFRSGNLSILPELSIPVNENVHKVRLLCSFRYSISL